MASAPFVIGLTGSIGMGKSETARLFAAEGIAVHDADAAVHRLYAEGGAAAPGIAALFPTAIQAGGVDRAVLSALITGDADAIARLETLVHPLVRADETRFLRDAAMRGDEIVVLDIPLLFETGAETRMDALVVASAPSEIQRRRVLARPGMTAEKFEALLARQVPDAEKRAKAHFVVVTDQGLDHARAQVQMILATVREKLRPHA